MTKDKLKQSLKNLRLSQVDFARVLGLHPRTINLWATGARKVPRCAELVLMLIVAVDATTREKIIMEALNDQQ